MVIMNEERSETVVSAYLMLICGCRIACRISCKDRSAMSDICCRAGRSALEMFKEVLSHEICVRPDRKWTPHFLTPLAQRFGQDE